MSSEIGKKIKRIRYKYNLSQKRFGYKLGISGKTISAYETGKITPNYKVLEKISEVYNENIITTSKDAKKQISSEITRLQHTLDNIKELLNI